MLLNQMSFIFVFCPFIPYLNEVMKTLNTRIDLSQLDSYVDKIFYTVERIFTRPAVIFSHVLTSFQSLL
jgi:hypothetical protein